ncbi:hypothetical protein [Anatilimnocola floriformis]|uniref:hypothetical protein n=1 Tax=Anatilimnocola floriformis TaxID=2948575 RepID=UPI0020C57F49|nr:hypothetical protein [Anatilimnocola floriformis]
MLRELRLFDRAESYCLEKLATPSTDEISRCELTVELLKTHAARAIYGPASQRAGWFQLAHDVAQKFLEQKSPRPVPVQLQAALTWLAEGELVAAEIRAGAVPGTELDRALKPLRTATAALDELNKFLTKEIPLLRRRKPAAAELSADELFSLQQHVLYQWAHVCRVRGELYPPKSPDRITLLQQAQEILRTPLTQVVPSDPLGNQVRLELVISERLLGNLANAAELLATLDKEPKPTEFRLRARAERIRTALDGQNIAEAVQIQEEGRLLKEKPAAELDLAWLETYLAAWQQAKNTADSKAWQEKAADLARLMATTHGAYWGRRGDQLLVQALAANPNGAGAAILSRAADHFYRQGDLAQAAVTYEKGSDQAFNAGGTEVALELAFKGALIQFKRELFTDAARRLRRASLKEPSNILSAAIHLQAVLFAAQEVRRDPQSSPFYLEILSEHIKTWPDDETTTQATAWLKQWQAHK